MLTSARHSALATAVIAAIIATIATVSPAYAHGNFDQSLEGDPGCNTSNFAASVTANGGQRQTFIPTGNQLSSVGLCVSAAASGTPLVIGIFSGSTLVGGGSSLSNPSIPDAAGPPVRLVHVDFTSPLPVSAGSTYTIEIQSGATITWYGTTASSPYTYCHGAPNTSAVVDFGFHTYTADAPAGSAPCPEPAATNTAIPPSPTNTPQPGPTNTPVPGATDTAATSTPVPGTTPSAQATRLSGQTTSGAAPGPSPGATGSSRGDTTAPGALPSSGSGMSQRPDFTPAVIATLALFMLLCGASVLRRGWSR